MTYLILMLMDLVPEDRHSCVCILHYINHLIEYGRLTCQQSAHLCFRLTLRTHICCHNLLFFWKCMLHNYLWTADLSQFFFSRKDPVSCWLSACPPPCGIPSFLVLLTPALSSRSRQWANWLLFDGTIFPLESWRHVIFCIAALWMNVYSVLTRLLKMKWASIPGNSVF